MSVAITIGRLRRRVVDLACSERLAQLAMRSTVADSDEYEAAFGVWADALEATREAVDELLAAQIERRLR